MVDEIRIADEFVVLRGNVGSFGHPRSIKYVALNNLLMPTIKPGDAALDLMTTTSFILWPFQTRRVKTGIKVELPEGVMGLIAERSSIGVKGVGVLARIIDTSYRGELIVVLHNFGILPRKFEARQRIAQILCLDYVAPNFRRVAQIGATWREARGFGEGTGT